MLSPGWGKQGRCPGGGDLQEEEGHWVWCGERGEGSAQRNGGGGGEGCPTVLCPQSLRRLPRASCRIEPGAAVCAEGSLWPALGRGRTGGC